MVARGLARAASRGTQGVALGLALLCGMARPVAAHPIHTTLAELSHDAGKGIVTVSLRLFADDFAAAVARTTRITPASASRAGTLPPDSAMFRYISERFAILVPAGSAGATVIALRWCGVRRSGDVLLVCLRAPHARPLGGVRIRNRLMSEVFDDQVNMVQASHGGRRQLLLFTNRDGAKLLS